MANNTLIPSAYVLSFRYGEPCVTIEATQYAQERPISWAIRKGQFVMSNRDVRFYHEPRPSERTDEFYQEFRFKNVVDAEVAFRKFNKEIEKWQ